ncbi:MAG: hypothetical protein IJ253_08575, partial [Bacteroidaceae bacterium]|nr:hypothetical protein [Bacteroidaceae bacterium]
SVNSVMMIMAFIFEQMSCYFEGAMGVHCNREVARLKVKKKSRLAHNSLLTDSGLSLLPFRVAGCVSSSGGLSL